MSRADDNRAIDEEAGDGSPCAKSPLGEFERLYRQSYPLVYNYVRRTVLDPHITEDVVSEAFTRAAQYYSSFDPERSKFSTWVISIARNCVNNHFRTAGPVVPVVDVSAPDIDEAVDTDEALHEALEAERALSVLEPKDREMVHMKYFEGLRNTDIAESLGMKPSTVSTRLARALAKMHDALSGGGA